MLRIRNMAEVVNPPPALLKDNELQVYSPKDGEYTNEKIILYKKLVDNVYLFPRGIFSNQDRELDESPNWKSIDFNIKFELKPHQKEIIEAFNNEYKYLKTFGGIIHAKTGTGKTVIAIYIMARLSFNTLIVVPTTYLLNQWIDRLLEHTDLKREDIGIIQSKKCEFNKPVVIGMLPSLSSIDYPEEMYRTFGLTIYDEGHLLGAKTFSTVAPKFWDSYRLMLSATPRRKDRTEKAFLYNIGGIIHTSKEVNTTPKIVLLQYHDKTIRKKFYNPYNSSFISSRFLNHIAEDKQRTRLLAKVIKNLYNKGRNILILSDRKPLLKSISLLISDIDFGWATGDKKDLNHKVILGTYQVAGLGLDIQELDTLIFATPRTDIEQAVGRILRKKNYEKKPMVVDLVDTGHDVIKRYWYKRLSFYNNINAEIKKVKEG